MNPTPTEAMEQKRKKTQADKRLEFETAVLYVLVEVAHTQYFHIVKDLAPLHGFRIGYRMKHAATEIEKGAREFHGLLSREEERTQEATGNSADAFRQFIRLLMDRVTDGRELAGAYDAILGAMLSNHGMVRPEDRQVIDRLLEWAADGTGSIRPQDMPAGIRGLLFEVYVLGVLSLMIDCELALVDKACRPAGMQIRPELKRGIEKLSHGCWGFYYETLRMKFAGELMIPGYIWMYQALLQCCRAMADRIRVGGEIWKVYNLLKVQLKTNWDTDLACTEHDAFGDMMEV